MKVLTSPINGHKIEIETHEDLIGMFVDKLGCFDAEVVKEVQAQLERTGSKVLVDVGANIGTVCVPLMEANSDLRLIAIEPIPQNLELLKKNLAPYMDRVHIAEVAVSEKEDFVIMEHYENNMGASRVSDTGESFECTTIDKLLSRLGITSGYVMKIDIEHHEPEAFRGMKEVLPSAVISETDMIEDIQKQLEELSLPLRRLFRSEKETLNGQKIGSWTALWHD